MGHRSLLARADSWIFRLFGLWKSFTMANTTVERAVDVVQSYDDDVDVKRQPTTPAETQQHTRALAIVELATIDPMSGSILT